MEPPTKQQKLDVPTTTTTSLIWLDDTITASEDDPVQKELRTFDPNLKLFQNDTDCENYIRSQSDQSLIVLIVNGRLGQQIIPRVQDLTQIIAIYIFCFNKEFHQTWTKDIAKVKDVVIHSHDLIQRLQTNHFHTTITEVNDEPENDSPYIISNICFDYLSRIEPTANDKDEFITSYQTTFAHQPQTMAILQVFQESYSSDRAVSWLRKSLSFCHILEDIFQSANTRTMYIFRSIIRDIHNQFEEHKCTSTISVYSGELMSEENLQELRNSVGQIMTKKSFYSTSCHREIAKVFPLDPGESRCVLFQIEANPKLEGVKPFMKTGLVYNQIDIDEVLFMIGSSFRINEVRDDGNGLTVVKMTLCANENESSIKNQLKIDNERHDLIGYAQLQYDLSQILKYPKVLHHIIELLEKYLNECQENHPNRYRCYDLLGSVTFAMNDWDTCLNWTLKSFEIKKQFLHPNDPQLVPCYECLASVYVNKGEATHALEPFKQILTIYKQIFGDDHVNLIQYYLRMIEIYEYEGKYTDVLLNYNQIFNIMLKHYPIGDLNLAPIYSNIGKTWASLCQYPLALGYYQTSLDIKLKHSTMQSDSIALSYKNIGFVHKDMNNIEQAKIHFEKAATIYRELHSPTHELVLEIEQILSSLQ